MQLNEIRIGNYFEINTVGQPCPDRLESGLYQWDNWYDYYEFGFNENIFKPIPLTEEWLERFGFHNNYRMEWWKGEILYDSGFVSKEVPAHGTYVKHVHQLQNLYFALTGEELKYK